MNSAVAFTGPLLSPQASSFTAELLVAVQRQNVLNVFHFFENWRIQIYLCEGIRMVVFVDPWSQMYRNAYEVLRRFWGVIDIREDEEIFLPITFFEDRLASLVSLSMNIVRIDPSTTGKIDIIENRENPQEWKVLVVFKKGNKFDVGSATKTASTLLALEDEVSRLAAFDASFSNSVTSNDVEISFPNAVAVVGLKKYPHRVVVNPELQHFKSMIETKYGKPAYVTGGYGKSSRCGVYTIVSFIGPATGQKEKKVDGMAFGAGLHVMSRTNPWKQILGIIFNKETMTFKNVKSICSTAIEIVARVEWTRSAKATADDFDKALSRALVNALQGLKTQLKSQSTQHRIKSLTSSILPIIRNSDQLVRHEIDEILAPIENESDLSALERYLTSTIDITRSRLNDDDDDDDDTQTIAFEDFDDIV